MSPSESIKKQLDERGIDYQMHDGGNRICFNIDYCEQCGDYLKSIDVIGACVIASQSYLTPEQAIAATVGNGTDLASRLRKVTGLRSFAELFGFSWEDESDWDWHDVACAMADAIDATAGTVMTLDQATERIEKFMGDYAKLLLESTLYVERDEPTDKHALDVAEQKEAQMARDLAEALTTADTEPDEATMFKLHDRMNAALLDYESAMGIEGGNGANTVPFVIEMHSLLEDAATMGAAGMCEGSFHESSDLSSGKVPLYYCKVTNKSIFIEREARFCPLCGKRIEVVSA